MKHRTFHPHSSPAPSPDIISYNICTHPPPFPNFINPRRKSPPSSLASRCFPRMSRALIRVLTHTHTHTGYSHTIRESVYAITFLDTFNLGARVRIHPRAFASLAREGERRVARKKEFPRGPNRYRRALISLSLSLSPRALL